MPDTSYQPEGRVANGSQADSPAPDPGATPGARLAFSAQDASDLAYVMTGNLALQLEWLTGVSLPKEVEDSIKSHLHASMNNCRMHEAPDQEYLHVAAASARRRWAAAAKAEVWE